ncbi:MAG TPA: HAMP domain-containing sensor histidine kinase, partial [Arenibaculum sp.]|nr:HAMP domain-containing sensor histidine kinase [Arenibaculum sp.]
IALEGARQEAVTAAENAMAASRSKTEFLANMSHELRTPLNAIIGFSEVIAKEMLGPTGTPRYVEYASDINRSAEDLLGTIDDVLDVAKIEAGRLELEEGLVDVGSALREVVGRMRDDARGAGIEIVPSVADGLPHLYGDGPKVRQVLFNLLNNAVTFSPAGSRVDVAAGRDGEAIMLSVVDRGIGMDEAEIAIAVSRFGQVASPWTRQHSGTGLGLPLSIGLVELHGGTLHIDSRKGFGTTVTVRFPPERSVSGAQLDGADLSRP